MKVEHDFDRVEAGRRLGHDLFRYRRSFDIDRVTPSVREGYDEARVRRTPTRVPDRFVRKWLQLRLNAARRDRVVNDDVTPELLRRIDVAECPVLRIDLTHGEQADSDWSVDRLNNDGAYAVNNLAVMSTGANRAKGDLGFADVLERSRLAVPARGLAAVEWMRLAALMLGPCLACSDAEAPLLPLNVPSPPSSVRLGAQQIQLAFTQGAARSSGKNFLIKSFKAACRDERSRGRLVLFADAIHDGLRRAEPPCDVWLEPAVMGAFENWRRSLDWRAWSHAIEISRVLARGTLISPARLATWHTDTRGYLS